MRILVPLFLFGCQNGTSTPPAINISVPNSVEEMSSPRQENVDSRLEEVRSTAMVYAKGVFSNANFDRFTNSDREVRLFYRAAAQMIMCDNAALSAGWNKRNFRFTANYTSLQITDLVFQEKQALVYIVEHLDGQSTDESLIVSLHKKGNDWCVQSEVSTNLYLQ